MTGRTMAAVGLLAVFLYVFVWKWTICRVYVPPGEMIVLSARLGTSNPDALNERVVDEGFQGVRKRVLGEGRYFINPLFYEITRHKAIRIENDEIGLVKSTTGQPLPTESFLVEVEKEKDIYARKGIWTKVLTPGVWRLNPVAFEFERAKAVKVLPGYVGCVTAMSGADPGEGKLADDGQRGVRKKVLQPGIYYVNQKAAKIVPVEVGYRELAIDDVQFPSRDGFTIQVDVTVVWGLEPKDVPHVMMHLGNVDEVATKILSPQIESICRIEGSKHSAKELIEGDSREKFQNEFRDQLAAVCKAKSISVRLGLVRSIDVPIEVRQPIQQARVATEERRTKIEQLTTQQKVNALSDLTSDIEKGVRETAADTEKEVAMLRAEGEKEVAKIQGERMVSVAKIEKEIAEKAAQRTRLLGEADATVTRALGEAEADKLKQSVDAIGGPAVYANYQFANNLPETFKVFIRYAGPGTFWTDLPAGAKAINDAASLKILQEPK